MHKMRSLLLALLFAAVLAACGSPSNTSNDTNSDSPLAGDETPGAKGGLNSSPTDSSLVGTPGTGTDSGTGTDTMGTTTP